MSSIFGDFHGGGEFYGHLNDTILVLIPKKKEAKELKDFRSINLLSSVYITLSKVLSSRLKVVMKGIISLPKGLLLLGNKSWMGCLLLISVLMS